MHVHVQVNSFSPVLWPVSNRCKTDSTATNSLREKYRRAGLFPFIIFELKKASLGAFWVLFLQLINLIEWKLAMPLSGIEGYVNHCN